MKINRITYLIFCLLAIMGTSIDAQTDQPSATTTTSAAQPSRPVRDSVILEEYCSVQTRGKLFSEDITIAIDYGDNPNNRQRLKDRSGKAIKFTSTIDALNYLGENGWKLVNAFPINSSANSAPQYTYIFKRFYLGKKPKDMD
ncbi:MAG: hypothetical protein ABI844_10190 [Saprospiraceae bacterium]